MAKLYPPILENSLPAFYAENQIIRIKIPFSMNRAVNAAAIYGISVKIKTVQSGSYLYSEDITNSVYYNLKWDNSYVIVNIFGKTEEELKIYNRFNLGQFYKIQLAFLDENLKPGYYSNVGVAKYTSYPSKLEIINMEKSINAVPYEFIGVYSQEGRDVTEQIYSYRFDVYDMNNNLYTTSGDQLHNFYVDNNYNQLYERYNYETRDKFKLEKQLESNEKYYIQYHATTVNGLELHTRRYCIMERTDLIEPEIEASLTASFDVEEARVVINLVGAINPKTKKPKKGTGSFILVRKEVNNEKSIWNQLLSFTLINEEITRQLYIDYTVESGKIYQYAIQQYNSKNLYSVRTIASDLIKVDYEYCYLTDCKRQLKIKYNPKIAKIKADILEQKVNTIGNQYPFIFRNGIVNYKEFTISGLLSHLADENECFITKEELGLIPDYITEKGRKSTADNLSAINYSNYSFRESLTNLNDTNINIEKNFKMSAFEWLTNGEPKIFKSPVEGNSIVRLLNTSLAPNDKLGRMIHSFSTTAYEVGEYTFNNLVKFNFIIQEELERRKIYQWETVKFAEEATTTGFLEDILYFTADDLRYSNKKQLIIDEDHIDQWPIGIAYTQWDVITGQTDTIEDKDTIKIKNYKFYQSGKVNLHPVKRVEFFDMQPGENIQIVFEDGSIIDIIIGITGRYIVDIEVPIAEIVLLNESKGKMTYCYYIDAEPGVPGFKQILNISYEDLLAKQFIGEGEHLFNLTKFIDNKTGSVILNPKQSISEMYYIKAYRRNLQQVTYNYTKGKYELFLDTNKQIKVVWPSPFTIYELVEYTDENNYIIKGYLDCYNNKLYNTYAPVLTITSNPKDTDLVQNNFINSSTNSIISLEEQFSFYTNIMNNNIENVSSGNGVVVEVGCLLRKTDYEAEIKKGKYPKLYELQQKYLRLMKIYNTFLRSDIDDYVEEAKYRNDLSVLYDQYIRMLYDILEREKEAYKEEELNG